MSGLTEDGRILLYLLKIMGVSGRQLLKDEMMERVATEPEAKKLLDAINTMERALGQLDRMTPDERKLLGFAPYPAEDK